MRRYGLLLAGIAAGIINGLFGGGGGMVLVPLLTLLTELEENSIFPASVGIILPICIVSIFFRYRPDLIDIKNVIIYLSGSALGGTLAGKLGKKIPTGLLHKLLGILILWGGIRYLC